MVGQGLWAGAVTALTLAAAATGANSAEPDLAKAFRLLQAQGRDAVYKGDIAKAIVAKEQALGGTMTVTSTGHGVTVEAVVPNGIQRHEIFQAI